MDKSLVFTGAHREENWFFKQYYYANANGRYPSFSLCLNLLNQKISSPVIVETGCQRLPEDIGGGMSTSIFAKYISRYGGELVTVDISSSNLDCAKQCVDAINPNLKVTYVAMDSIEYLRHTPVVPDLLYLDSFDYPYGELLRAYGGTTDIVKAETDMWKVEAELFMRKHQDTIRACQEHCVNEFLAIEARLKPTTILLLDDNLLPGGGKPHKLKELLPSKGWICLLDSQQSVWVQRI